ncbi:ABC transporter permease [Agromyces protaetiae]|uniref:ABC transporter permease n=1 Tax=Agromyces protaetiae TaxID=2509455 RepID=A0A4P6FDZ3_9MICO|nr:ABC transporter permease [Agromyces protaetiae]QAY74125.1 ABC transporter permease [Agromyces protaetiae]
MNEQNTRTETSVTADAAPITTGSVVVDPRESQSAFRRFLGGPVGRNLGLIVALLAIIAVGAITAGDNFLTVNTFLTIVRQASVWGVLAIGMTFVIIAGGIDLSVGSVLGLASVVATLTVVQDLADESTWVILIFIPLLVGLAAGVLNGVIIAYGNVVAFMATLAMLVAARGLAEVLAQRRTLVLGSGPFKELVTSDFLGIDILIWIFAIVSVAGWILLNRTTFGRRTVAIGGNREAARLAGINVKRHTIYLYGLAGLSAGIAAILILGRTTAGSSTNGQLYELDAIAAVVVGGTLLTGGRGTIVGTVLGVLIFSTLTNVFVQNNLDSSVQAIAKGVIIVIAVLLQQRFSGRTVRE